MPLLKICALACSFVILTTSLPAQAENIAGFLGRVSQCAEKAKGRRDTLNKMIKDVKSTLASLDKKAQLARRPSLKIVQLMKNQPTSGDADDMKRFAASKKALCASQTRQVRRSLAGLANKRTSVTKLASKLQAKLNNVGNATLACSRIFPEGVTKIISWLTEFSNSLNNFKGKKVDYRDLTDVPTGCDSLPAYGGGSGIEFSQEFLDNIK